MSSNRRRKQEQFARAVFVFAVGMIIAIMILLLCGAKPQAVGYDYISGSSLWDLARECPDNMDKRDYIAEIMALNAMDSSIVYADRLYQVPIYEK